MIASGTTRTMPSTSRRRSAFDALDRLGLPGDRDVDRGGERGDQRDAERAGAQVALLAAAVQQRGRVELAADQQRADADGAAELVRRDRHGVELAGAEVEGHVAGRLHGVAVHRDVVLTGDPYDVGDGLDRAHLVVGPHRRDDRDRRRVALDAGPQLVDQDAAGGVDGRHVDLGALVLGQPGHRVEQRMVLDRAEDDAAAGRVLGAARPVEALDRQVVGLGAAGREHDLARPRAEPLGDQLARLLDGAPRAPPRRVQRRRIARDGPAPRPSPRSPQGPSASSPHGRSRPPAQRSFIAQPA